MNPILCTDDHLQCIFCIQAASAVVEKTSKSWKGQIQCNRSNWSNHWLIFQYWEFWEAEREITLHHSRNLNDWEEILLAGSWRYRSNWPVTKEFLPLSFPVRYFLKHSLSFYLGKNSRRLRFDKWPKARLMAAIL